MLHWSMILTEEYETVNICHVCLAAVIDSFLFVVNIQFLLKQGKEIIQRSLINALRRRDA
jgi:hypothetical protein